MTKDQNIKIILKDKYQQSCRKMSRGYKLAIYTRNKNKPEILLHTRKIRKSKISGNTKNPTADGRENSHLGVESNLQSLVKDEHSSAAQQFCPWVHFLEQLAPVYSPPIPTKHPRMFIANS